MDIKDVILIFCAKLEENLNLQGSLNSKTGQNTHKVKLICEMKPAGYFLPQIHPGTSKTALLHDNEPEAFFVELWLDNRCLFRQFNIPENVEITHVVEFYLLTELLNTVFEYGVTAMDNSLLKQKI